MSDITLELETGVSVSTSPVWSRWSFRQWRERDRRRRRSTHFTRNGTGVLRGEEVCDSLPSLNVRRKGRRTCGQSCFSLSLSRPCLPFGVRGTTGRLDVWCQTYGLPVSCPDTRLDRPSFRLMYPLSRRGVLRRAQGVGALRSSCPS